MNHLPPRGLLFLLAAPPLLAGAVAAAALVYGPSLAARSSVPAAAAVRAGADLAAGPIQPRLLVHVTGGVAHPGLYRLNRGQRVADAISAAGGLTEAADRGRMPDLAGILRDGQQVRVPLAGASGAAGRASALDLNAAAESELAAVPGFTPELARAAVQYRSLFGAFTAVKELQTALGMDPAAYALARQHLRV